MKKVNSGGGGQADLPDKVAGANGREEKVKKFSEEYSTLYNSSGSKIEMNEQKEKMDPLNLVILPVQLRNDQLKIVNDINTSSTEPVDTITFE